MKARTKVAGLALAAVALVGASVLGTVAYLTSSDAVTNTFTVGNVQITLDEAKANADGTLVAEADRVQANEYKLMPGHEYAKDPVVHLAAGSEDAYLFVKIENGIAAIEAGDTIADQMEANSWILIDAENNVYAYEAIAEPGDYPVFEQFAISGDVEGDNLADFADAQIVVTAYAIQADGFATVAAAAAALSF